MFRFRLSRMRHYDIVFIQGWDALSYARFERDKNGLSGGSKSERKRTEVLFFSGELKMLPLATASPAMSRSACSSMCLSSSCSWSRSRPNMYVASARSAAAASSLPPDRRRRQKRHRLKDAFLRRERVMLVGVDTFFDIVRRFVPISTSVQPMDRWIKLGLFCFIFLWISIGCFGWVLMCFYQVLLWLFKN